MRGLAIGPRSFLCTLDPGKYRCGLAVFFDGALVSTSEPEAERTAKWAAHVTARTVVGQATSAMSQAVPAATPTYPVVWVAEVPQTYEAKEAREGNLEELRAVVEQVQARRLDAYRAEGMATCTPHEWKGNVPKPVHHARILRALTDRERAIVEALPRYRDALDAVGLGLFVLGRLGRGGRKPPR